MPDGPATRPEIVFPPVTPAVRARRAGFRLAFRVLQLWWFVRRPQTNGVKMLVRSGDEVLFVRHTYGDRARWELPGGGLQRGETPVAAARRETREELGIDVEGWAELGAVTHRQYATARLAYVEAAAPYDPVRIAPEEILDACWAPLTRPPEPLGAHARAGLALTGQAGGIPT